MVSSKFVKEGALSTTSDIMNYISYSTKVSELAKIYPLARVVHYDDLYRRMQFATGCKWGTESQFIYQQSLHKLRNNGKSTHKKSSISDKCPAGLLSQGRA